MKKIYIGSSDSEKIFDVSSADIDISSNASTTIQTEFSEAAKHLGEIIKKRVEEKNAKPKAIAASAE